MTSKTMVILGHDRSNGLASVDPSTGTTIRGMSTSDFTDSVEYMYVENDYIWASDYDCNLSLFTSDLVLLKTVDTGTMSDVSTNFPKAFHIVGDYLYLVSTRQHDNEATSVNAKQLVIRKFNKLTLTQVSEAYITDSDFWTASGSVVQVNQYVGFWGSTYVWLNARTSDDNGTTIWKKFEFATGDVLDTWTNGPEDWIGIPHAVNLEEYYTGSKVLMDIPNNSYPSTFRVVNFGTKTISGTINYDIQAAGVAAGFWDEGQYLSDGLSSSRQGPLADMSNDIFKFIATIPESGGPVGQTQYRAFYEVSVNLVTGAVTVVGTVTNLGIETLDSNKQGMVGQKNFFYPSNFSYISPNVWFASHDYGGYGLINFSNDTMSAIGQSSWQQGYSSDGNSYRVVQVATLNETTITGTVSQTGSGVSGRAVHLYDEETGEKVASTTSTGGGTYTFEKYTGRRYFAVAQSSGGSENYKIKTGLSSV